MKFRFFSLSLFLIIPIFGQAQGVNTDTSQVSLPSLWTKSWVINLRANQANYKDWSMGGVNSSAFVASTKFKAKYADSKFSNTSKADLRFGQINQKGSGVRKTEDLILLSNKTDYFIKSGIWSAFLEVSFRTQFTEGFDFTDQLISDFLSPGYFIESLGLSHQPNDNFNFQLGLGLKQTTVEADGLDDYYGLVEDQDVRWEGGMTFALAYKKEIFKNFTYETEIATFTNLVLPWRSTDVYMTNLFTGVINSFLTTTFEWSFIYDDDFGNLLQNMRVLSLGIRIDVFRTDRP